MKHLFCCLLVLSLVGCSKPLVQQDPPTPPDVDEPIITVTETNEDALFYLSIEDLVLVSTSNSKNAFALDSNDTKELINILNETSLTGEEMIGERISELSYTVMKVHDKEYTFFGEYYITSKNGVDTFKQMDSSKIYDLFTNKMNLSLTDKDRQWLTSNEYPEKNKDTEWLEQERLRKEQEQKHIHAFINHYNQLDLSTLPIYWELGIEVPEHVEVEYLEGFRNLRHYEDGIAVDKHFNDDYYVDMSYSMNEEPNYTLYINERFMRENAQLIPDEHEITKFAYNALNAELGVMIYKSGTGLDSVTFDGYTTSEIKEIQHKHITEGITTGDMYFKITSIEDYPIETREDVLKYYSQYFTEERAQRSVTELFNTTFEERDDGVYMDVTYNSDIVSDLPSLGISTYMLDTEDAVYVYYRWLPGITDYYNRYLRYRFTKTPDGLRY